MITLKTRFGKVVEVVVPGLLVVSTAVGILGLLGVESVDDITAWLDSLG